jgi:polar amino acid transport system permease protein
MAEIVRGGIASVDHGQTVACRALGMSAFTKMWYVILPQALRAIIPPTGNELINMLKSTALVSVIALADLLYSADLIASRTYQTIPLLIVASIWYLAMTSVLSVIQIFLERRVSRGFQVRAQPRWMMLRRGVFTGHATVSRDENHTGDPHA